VRAIAITKRLTEQEWRQELFARGLHGVSLFRVNSMRVLSYNLNILPHGNPSVFGSEHGSRSERVLEFVALIAASSYDVLALQEVFASPFVPSHVCLQRKLLAELKRLGYLYTVTGPTPGWRQLIFRRKWTDSGLVIASRFPITYSDTTRFVCVCVSVCVYKYILIWI
jgi:hypothetical protein